MIEPSVVHMQLPDEGIMIEARELTDAERDAVCGGVFNFGTIVAQPIDAMQVGRDGSDVRIRDITISKAVDRTTRLS